MIDTQAIRGKILDFAIQGKLTEQLPEDGTAEELYQQIHSEKQALIAAGKIKKEKPLPEITAEEIPFELPHNWKWVRLGAIAHQITDGTHRTPTYQNEGVPFLSVKDISAGYLDLSDIKHISLAEHVELSKRCKPEKNDVLVCRIGTLGKALRIDTDLEFSIFVSLGLIKIGNEVLSNHIVTVINSEYGAGWIQSIKAGGAMHAYKINLTDLNLLPVPLPPLAEQQRIYERLEEVHSALKIIDKLQAQYADNLTVLKGKLIDAAIQGKLTEQLPEDGTAEELYHRVQAKKQALIESGRIKREKPLPTILDDDVPYDIPKTWKWIHWGDVVNIVSARRVHQADWRESGVPFYRAREIAKLAEDGFVNNELFISEELYSEFSKSGVPQENDLMVSAVGTLGRTYVVKATDRFYYKDASVLCFENFGSINPHFLAYVMKSDLMRQQIESNSGGTTVDTLTMVRMVKYLLPLPPRAEQDRIVNALNEALVVINA